MTSRALFFFSLTLACAGCASTPASRVAWPEPAPAEVRDIAVVRFATPRSKGSAIPLGQNRFCTCMHNFAMKEIALAEQPTGGIIFDGGGGEKKNLADWAMLDVEEDIPIEGRLARIVPDFRPAIGEPVYLIGYGTCRECGADPSQAVRLPVTKQIYGGIATTPSPSWLFAPRDYIYVRAPCRGAYAGGSGGLAVCWSEAHEEWVGVGMYFMYKQGTHVCIPFRTSGVGRRFIPYHYVAQAAEVAPADP